MQSLIQFSSQMKEKAKTVSLATVVFSPFGESIYFSNFFFHSHTWLRRLAVVYRIFQSSGITIALCSFSAELVASHLMVD